MTRPLPVRPEEWTRVELIDEVKRLTDQVDTLIITLAELQRAKETTP